MQTQVILENRSPEIRQFLNNVQQTVHTVAPEADIVLYGSRARGDAGPASDWDILILVERPIDRQFIVTLRDRLYDLELETNNIISSIIRTRQEWDSPRYSVLPFKRQVEQDGVVL